MTGSGRAVGTSTAGATSGRVVIPRGRGICLSSRPPSAVTTSVTMSVTLSAASVAGAGATTGTTPDTMSVTTCVIAPTPFGTPPKAPRY